MDPNEIGALVIQIFSAPVMVFISIILSGIMLQRVLPPLAAVGELKLPTVIVRIGVKGDGAAYGLIFFFLSLITSFLVVPISAYNSFVEKSGLEIKNWLFFLLTASCIGLVVSTIVFFSIETVFYNPILSKYDRQKQLKLAREVLSEDRNVVTGGEDE